MLTVERQCPVLGKQGVEQSELEISLDKWAVKGSQKIFPRYERHVKSKTFMETVYMTYLRNVLRSCQTLSNQQQP